MSLTPVPTYPSSFIGHGGRGGTRILGHLPISPSLSAKTGMLRFADIHGETLTGTHVLVPGDHKIGEYYFVKIDFGALANRLKNDLNAKMYGSARH